MEEIKIFVEHTIELCGLTGPAVPVVRHISLAVVAILLAWLSDFLCRRLLVPVILKVTAKTEATWDDTIFNRKVLASACHIVPAVVIWQLLPMVFYQFPLVREILARVTAIYITIMSVRLATVVINSLKDIDTDHSSSSQQYFHTFCGVFKILIIFVAVIVVVAIVLDRSPMKLFAGLGATSAILMLVFKDTLEGLVAGIRLTSNDMVHKGDWITVPSSNANGIVEEISLSTVKVRNFDNTITTLSPITLVNGSFQNWKGMQQSAGRRVNRTVYYDFRSVRIIDAEIKQNLIEKKYFTEKELEGEHVNMGLYRRYVEKYLVRHKEVNDDMTFMVRQEEATQCGLPVEFYFFLKNKEWTAYEHNLADIMEWVYALAPEFGLKIYEQYPEQ